MFTGLDESGEYFQFLSVCFFSLANTSDADGAARRLGTVRIVASVFSVPGARRELYELGD